MKLTSFTNHSITVLLLAARKKNQLLTVPQISKSHNISKAILVKILHRLKNENYIQTFRGKKGGFCLKKKADTIHLGDLIKYTEMSLNETMINFEEKKTSQLNYFDQIKYEAFNAFIKKANCYTIADLDELVLTEDKHEK